MYLLYIQSPITQREGLIDYIYEAQHQQLKTLIFLKT